MPAGTENDGDILSLPALYSITHILLSLLFPLSSASPLCLRVCICMFVLIRFTRLSLCLVPFTPCRFYVSCVSVCLDCCHDQSKYR